MIFPPSSTSFRAKGFLASCPSASGRALAGPSQQPEAPLCCSTRRLSPHPSSRPAPGCLVCTKGQVHVGHHIILQAKEGRAPGEEARGTSQPVSSKSFSRTIWGCHGHFPSVDSSRGRPGRDPASFAPISAFLPSVRREVRKENIG